MRTTSSISGRGVGLATSGLLALALTGVPTVASGATAPVAPKPGNQATQVSSISQLRAAVARANTRDGRQVITLGRDISFDPSAKAAGGAGFGDLDVTDDLVVNGRGRTVDARRVDRVFDVAAGATLVLRHVTLTGGRPAAGESGGAVQVAGTLTATDVTMVDNSVTGELASGGAVFNDGGVVEIVKSRLARNAAVRAGGAIEALEGRTVVRGSTLVANTTGAEPGNGGGLHLTEAGVVVVNRSKVIRNSASAEGGGLWNSANGTMRVTRSVVSKNTVAGVEDDQGGGGLYNDGGVLRVSSSKVLKNKATGELGSGGGILNVNGTVVVDDTRLGQNRAKRAGGGIETNDGSVSLTGVVLVDNVTGAAPGNGGGLHLTGAAEVTYDGGRTTGNKAAAQGGGLWNSETGTLVVTDVTIRKNTAPEKPNSYNDGGVFTIDGEPVAAEGDGGGGLPLPF